MSAEVFPLHPVNGKVFPKTGNFFPKERIMKKKKKVRRTKRPTKGDIELIARLEKHNKKRRARLKAGG
jgi:hypothetical protein